MIELLFVAFLIIPVLLVGGALLAAFAVMFLVFKAILWLVLLPLRLVFWVVAAPLLLFLKALVVLLSGAVLLPLMAVAAIVALIVGFLFVFLPALPLFLVAAIVWFAVKATSARPVSA